MLRLAHWARARDLTTLGRHADAVPDWDQALALWPAPASDNDRLEWAIALADKGEYNRATADAQRLAGKAPRDGRVLYNAACVFAVASAAVARDAKLVAGERDALAEQYAAGAVQLLAKARGVEYFKDARSVNHLKEDRDLDPLRRREDFKKLLTELEEQVGAGPQTRSR